MFGLDSGVVECFMDSWGTNGKLVKRALAVQSEMFGSANAQEILEGLYLRYLGDSPCQWSTRASLTLP